MIESTCILEASDDHTWAIEGQSRQVCSDFAIKNFLLGWRLRLGETNAFAYNPPLSVMFSILIGVIGNWVLQSGVRRHYMIRIPHHGRIELFIADVNVSVPHAKLFAYKSEDLNLLHDILINFATYVSPP